MGTRVGPYIVTATLGLGTFGKVKLARHNETNVEYAIKILDKTDIMANELTQNVRQEIAIMKALHHPNIVNLREVLSSKSKLYIVMDLVRGGELFDHIERFGSLNEKLARKYFQQLVDGVHYCHRRGVYHRDLKPENLLVDENGVLKITDFGVSSMKGGVGGSDLLYTAVGTPYYCAPEIINGAEDGYSGIKIDAWSCGIILFLLLTGTLPFEKEDMTALFAQISSCDVQYPAWMQPDARDLIARLLTRDPAARYDLESVRAHPWFQVDYAPHAAGSFSGSSKRRASRGSGRSRDRLGHSGSTGRRSSDALPPRQQTATTATAQQQPPPLTQEAEPAPVVRNLLADFEGKDLAVLIKAALPGKPAKRIELVVSKLDELDIECVEDIQFLAETLKRPQALTAWLQEKSALPAVTCMRVSRFFFE